MPTPTRGINISAYNPAFANGAMVNRSNLSAAAVANANISAKAVTSAKIRAAFLSGSIVSGKKTFAIAHGLGVRPKFVAVGAITTLTQTSSAQNAGLNLATSAATSTSFYVQGSQTQNTAMKYWAYVQL